MDGLVGGPDPPPLNPALKVGRPTRAAIIGSYRARSTLSTDAARAAARSAYFADACVARGSLARKSIAARRSVCLSVYGRRRRRHRRIWARRLSTPPAVIGHESVPKKIIYTSLQWRRQRGEGRGSFPLWVDVQKLCNMCVLSLSRNFFVSHDKYIARPSSKEPR